MLMRCVLNTNTLLAYEYNQHAWHLHVTNWFVICKCHACIHISVYGLDVYWNCQIKSASVTKHGPVHNILYWIIVVPLKSVGVNVTIGAAICHVESVLVYISPWKDPVETIFKFPLDEQSAVYRFEAEINGKVIVSECQEREQVYS